MSWDRGETDTAPEVIRRSKYQIKCSVSECKNTSISKGLCCHHGQRMANYGDVTYVTPHEKWRELCREAKISRGATAKPSSYRKLFGRHEHRVVVENEIGRPLGVGEIVHHKDEDKHNNDPTNLEIVTRSEHAKIHLHPRRRRA